MYVQWCNYTDVLYVQWWNEPNTSNIVRPTSTNVMRRCIGWCQTNILASFEWGFSLLFVCSYCNRMNLWTRENLGIKHGKQKNFLNFLLFRKFYGCILALMSKIMISHNCISLFHSLEEEPRHYSTQPRLSPAAAVAGSVSPISASSATNEPAGDVDNPPF
jgi:hypothetical protein